MFIMHKTEIKSKTTKIGPRTNDDKLFKFLASPSTNNKWVFYWSDVQL